MKTIAVIDQACCPRVLETPIDADQAGQIASALRVIADPARLRLVSLLSSGEACVCDLTEPLGLSQPTVSHHLRILAEAGLVEREQRGKWAYYRMVPERLELLRSALAPVTEGSRT